MLILNQNDIQQAVISSELIEAIEQAYGLQHHPETHIPDRMQINQGENTLLLMPGFIRQSFGTKIVSVFPGNSSRNKSAIQGFMVMNNAETGEPIALLNGAKLTALRTAAAGATAIRHLASPKAQTLGIIGAGVQAYYQAMIGSTQRDFKRLIICDKSASKANELKQQLLNKMNISEIESAHDANRLVVDSDVIITATTSNQAVFDLEAKFLKYKTFIGIGSYKPGMQEIPSLVYQLAEKIFVDTLHAKEESGDLCIPLKQGLIREQDIIPFGQILNDDELKNNEGVHVFKSVGMSLFDLTVAGLIYRNAIKKGLGTEVEL